MSNLIGRRLGPYNIVGMLGKGSMATVYRAHHATTTLEAVLKVLAVNSGGYSELVKRFERVNFGR
ncbi:MAG TPA: hypothetical protein PLD47_02880 [Aggregatilineales bacterium]|nr:hypothetical protein [Anaerolineales bacterium]HRE46645.1 hypothetical protein [Aggregatilineales bacterium]